MNPAWLVLMLAVTVPIVGRGYWYRRQEARSLRALSRREGLTFSPVDLIGLHERYYNLNLVRQGHSRHAWNVIYGATSIGLLAMFRYSYDLGFGADQSSRQNWLVVLETPEPLPVWTARPTDPAETGNEAGTGIRIGPLTVQIEQMQSARMFEDATLRAVLLGLPGDWQIESRGRLLAIAAPWDENPSLPGRLLASVEELARTLPGTVS